MVISVGRVSGGELSYQVECQDNKMELEQNYSWNIIITFRIIIYLYLYFTFLLSSSVTSVSPVVSHLLFGVL